MDQLQKKLNQLNGLQTDVDENNKLLNALGQSGGDSVYTRLPSSTLAGMEPNAGDAGGITIPQVSVLAGIMGTLDADRAERTTTALANLDLQAKDARANWVSYDAYNQIKNMLEAAGYEGNLTRSQAAQLLAQAQQANSWGATLGNALVDSVKQGGVSFGQTLGGAAANGVSSAINIAVTGGPKPDGGGSADASGGGVNTGGNGSGSGGGGSSGSGSGGGNNGSCTDGDKGAGGGGSSPGGGGSQGVEGAGGGRNSSGSGSGGGGNPGVVSSQTNPDGTITVHYSCGNTWTGKPPAPTKCPRCNQGTPTSTTVNSGGAGGSGSAPSGGGSNPNVVSSQTNPDGTVTVRYSCGYKWTGKPPAPAKCPRCNQGTPTSTTVNSSGSGGNQGVVGSQTGSVGRKMTVQTYPTGTTTTVYPCGHRWTGKPPAPAKCPICKR